jgi:Eukaryotic aspartyl protease
MLLTRAAPSNIGNGLVALPLRQTYRPTTVKRGIPEADLLDLTIAYLADIYIGTPPQNLGLQIDTGSSPVWVNPNCHRAVNQQLCELLPAYDPTASSPKRFPALDGLQAYYTGDTVMLEGYSDVFRWSNGVTIPDQPFGVANDSVGSNLGMLGLGPDLSTGFDSIISNYSVVSTMAREGIIKSRTFSLGLDTTMAFESYSGILNAGDDTVVSSLIGFRLLGLRRSGQKQIFWIILRTTHPSAGPRW